MREVGGVHYLVEKGSGRQAFLRGVNVGGATKIPVNYSNSSDAGFCELGQFGEVYPALVGNSNSGVDGSLSNTKSISFVGRPFPLSEADAHFRRLRAYGFNFLRFLVTWEALEGAAPGVYDLEYVEYVAAVLKK